MLICMQYVRVYVSFWGGRGGSWATDVYIALRPEKNSGLVNFLHSYLSSRYNFADRMRNTVVSYQKWIRSPNGAMKTRFS